MPWVDGAQIQEREGIESLLTEDGHTLAIVAMAASTRL